jgi:spore germination protein GerM
VWFLCPAWFLLLVSIQGCTQRIIAFHNTNILLVRQMSALFSANHEQHLKVRIARLHVVVGRMPMDQEKTQTLSTAFSNANEVLGKSSTEEGEKVTKLLQKAFHDDKMTGIAARIGIIATTIALLLICIFAIESILRM